MDVAIKDITISGRHRKDLGDIKGLANSIGEIGLLQPIILDQGNRLIAGERRIEAFRTLGHKKIPAIRCKHITEALEYVIAESDENTCRKGFTPSEAVAIGIERERLVKAEAKQRMLKGKRQDDAPSGKFPEGSKGRAREVIADTVGMSDRTYEKAKAVVESGDQDLINQMDKTGKVDGAYKKMKSKKKAKAKRVDPSPSAKARMELYRLIKSDFRTAKLDEPLDFVITDPPYPKKYVPLFADLSKFCADHLKDGGSLLCMTGQSYLPDYIRLLSEHLTYQWVFAYMTPGPQCTIHARKINSGWKPVLWFVKGAYRGDMVSDVFTSDARDKEHHGWGQSVSGLSMIVERMTYPKQLICDPFLGGGSTAVACVTMDRRFIGIDIDQECISTTRERLQYD